MRSQEPVDASSIDLPSPAIPATSTSSPGRLDICTFSRSSLTHLPPVVLNMTRPAREILERRVQQLIWQLVERMIHDREMCRQQLTSSRILVRQ